jgi:hypothetical protein
VTSGAATPSEALVSATAKLIPADLPNENAGLAAGVIIPS